MAEKMKFAPTDYMNATIIDGKPSLAVEVTVALSSKESHVYSRQGKILLQTAGLRKINRYAKVSIIKPQYQYHDGKKVENPYYVKDAYGNTIAAKIRGTGIGLVVGGGIVMLDQSVYYDIKAILLSEISRTIQRNAYAGFWAPHKYDEMPQHYHANIEEYHGNTKSTVQNLIDVPEQSRWNYIEIDPILGGFYYNILNPDIEKVARQHIDRMSSLSSRMNTYLERQILKNHPVIGSGEPTRVISDKKDEILAEFKLVTWKTALTKEELSKLKEAVEKGETFLENLDNVHLLTVSQSMHTDDKEMQEEEEVETFKDDEEEAVNEERQDLIKWITDPKRVEKSYAYMTKPVYQCSVDELREIKKSMGGK